MVALLMVFHNAPFKLQMPDMSKMPVIRQRGQCIGIMDADTRVAIQEAAELGIEGSVD